ncbi:MAG: outer membrane protein transport protein [Polyangiales bacterium]
MKNYIGLLVAALICLQAATVHAGGFYLTDRGTRPMSRGFAFVAGVDDPQALWYNPAGLGFSGKQLLIDATLPIERTSFTRNDGGVDQPTVKGNQSYLPIPMVAYSHPITDKITLGIGVMAPSSVVKSYPSGLTIEGTPCNPQDEGCTVPAPQRYSLLSLKGSGFAQFTAAASYKVMDDLVVGFGAHLMTGVFKATSTLSACDGAICAFPEDPEYDGVAEISAFPLIHPGMQIGAIYHNDFVKLGFSYTVWPFKKERNAEIKVRLPSAAIFDGAYVDGKKAKLDVGFPPMTARLGAQFNPIRDLGIEVSVVWERWSELDQIGLNPKNIWLRDVTAIGDYQIGSIGIQTNANDTWSVRLGGEWEAIQDRLRLAMGGMFETATFDDEYLSPMFVDSKRYFIGGGGSVKVSKKLWLDGSFGIQFLPSRTVTNSKVEQQNPLRPNQSDAVTPSYVGNGHYTARVYVLGVGMRLEL